MKKRTAKIITWTILALIIAVGIVTIGGRLIVIQKFSSPFLFVSEDPSTGNEAWFIWEGFVDRGCSLYAKSTTHKAPIPVTDLSWDGQYLFMGAEWSKDGQVIAATLRILGGTYPEVRGYAYDFQGGRALMPEGKSMNKMPQSIDWLSAQSNILKVVEAHGGFTGNFISHDAMMQSGKSIWIWEIPN
jgi:hypothetical protein